MIAYARDGAGNEAASEPCVWTVGPLSVPITSPAAGATVSGAVLVNAQPLAGDQIPKEIDIIGVDFSVDGVSKASDDATPYQSSVGHDEGRKRRPYAEGGPVLDG